MMTDEERVRALDEALERRDDDDFAGLIVEDDPVLRAASRLIEYFGAWYDPVLSPAGAVEVATVALNVRTPR